MQIMPLIASILITLTFYLLESRIQFFKCSRVQTWQHCLISLFRRQQQNPIIKKLSAGLNKLMLITRIWLGLSHFQFHKFEHSFQNPLNTVCNAGAVETIIH